MFPDSSITSITLLHGFSNSSEIWMIVSRDLQRLIIALERRVTQRGRRDEPSYNIPVLRSDVSKHHHDETNVSLYCTKL